MPFSFRKSIRLGKYARVNVSKRGVSASAGAGGLRYTTKPILPTRTAQPEIPVEDTETQTPRTSSRATRLLVLLFAVVPWIILLLVGIAWLW